MPDETMAEETKTMIRDLAKTFRDYETACDNEAKNAALRGLIGRAENRPKEDAEAMTAHTKAEVWGSAARIVMARLM
ncbi:MAG: hypothetical protein WA003_15670 [Desulfuromonadaceae bacterium]